MTALPLAAAVILAAAAAPREAESAVREAARSYFAAITRGDAEAALALVADPSDADRLAVRASAASEEGLRRLEDLATSAFREQGRMGIAERHRGLLAAIERAPVELVGDRAVVRPENVRLLRLRRVSGAWKVESPAARLTGQERRELEESLRKVEDAAKDLGERIRSGAAKGAQEARDALRKALGPDEDGVPL